jgi:archaetidylinositol phosphate synthase
MHVREHRSVTAAVEKRLLVWTARRLPPWITSDWLTAGGLAAMVCASAGFAALRITPWAACIVVGALVLNWLGDSLDGTVARVRRLERPRYGYYVDHVVDLAGTAVLLAGMAASARMHPLVACGVLIAYLLASAESYLATHAVGVFKISFAGFGPTELRFVLAIGAIAVARDPWISSGPLAGMRVFDVGGGVASVSLLFAFVARAVAHARLLAASERRIARMSLSGADRKHPHAGGFETGANLRGKLV